MVRLLDPAYCAGRNKRAVCGALCKLCYDIERGAGQATIQNSNPDTPLIIGSYNALTGRFELP